MSIPSCSPRPLRVLICGFSLLALGSTFNPCLPEARAQTRELSQYYYHERAVQLIVDLDSLGIHAPYLSMDSLETLVGNSTVGAFARVSRNLGSGMFLLGLESALPRDSLVSLSRSLTGSLRPAIRSAGLSVRLLGTPDPSFVTDQFIVEFLPDVSREEIDDFNASYGVRVVGALGLLDNDFLLEVTDDAGMDALDLASLYHQFPQTKFAHPNFITPIRKTGWFPDDEFFGDQWHLHNTGQFGGTPDADIDAPEAWDITKGDPGIVIAIIEPEGFDIQNPDIAANLWTNTFEVGDGSNHDGPDLWVKEDDLHGWDFVDCPTVNEGGPTPTPENADSDPCGFADFTVPDPNDPSRQVDIWHGTAVAGLAAARAGNKVGNTTVGVVGVCPFCQLMLIRLGVEDVAIASAFRYAWKMGADVINNSWYRWIGTDYVEAQIDLAATKGRGGLGSVVVFSVKDTNEDNCQGSANELFSAMDNVVAVSASTERDTKANPAGYGKCLDLLAPGFIVDRVADPGGNHWDDPGIATTDVVGAAGTNLDEHPSRCALTEFTAAQDGTRALDYTRCFSGTSAAAPIVSGVAGLMLSANPNMYRGIVQDVLNETADQIEPDVANYDPVTKHSDTHGYGRVNAFAAVQGALDAGICIVLPDLPTLSFLAVLIPIQWMFDFVSGDHHIDNEGVWVEEESFDPETGSLDWVTRVSFADRNRDDDYWWEVSHGILALEGAFGQSGETDWIEASGGRSTNHGSFNSPELIGFDAATVVLKGWEFDYDTRDHHIDVLGIRISDVDYDPEMGTITWQTVAEFQDKQPDDDYSWRYQWQVIALNDGAVANISRAGVDGGNTTLDPSSVTDDLFEGSQNAVVLPQGWRLDYARKDHEVNAHRVGVRNISLNPDDGTVGWAAVFNYSDKNFDDDYRWEYYLAAIAFEEGRFMTWWGGPERDGGGSAQRSYSVIIR